MAHPPEQSRTPAPRAHADGVVCFAGTDWWYHPRGHSECQLMRRLARRTTVLWINSIGMRAPKPGATQRPMRRYARKLRSSLRLLRRDPSGIWVYSPLFIPRYTPRAARLNGLLLRAQIAILRRLLNIKRPAAFVTLPTAAHAALEGGFARVVFNRADDYARFPEADSALIQSLERALIARGDTTYYVNRELLERERTTARNPEYLGHGLDFAHFARDRHDFAGDDIPEALRAAPRPIIGFYGGLEPYTVDIDLLIATARRFPHATLAIIGPRSMNTEALEAEPNVRCLDPIPYERLPAAAAQFDVALMPWVQSDWIRACNPIKLKEYLALGAPIVSTPFPALDPYQHLVHTGETREGFLDAVERALNERDDAKRLARRSAVSNDSWDTLADRVAQALGLAPTHATIIEAKHPARDRAAA